MSEELLGVGVCINGVEIILALSANVFTLGVELYNNSVNVRLGPIMFGVHW